MASNDTDTETLAKVLGIVLFPILMTIIFLLLLPVNLLEAWVLKLMYEWFIVPFGLPIISFWHFVGITLFVSLVHLYFKDTYRNYDRDVKANKLIKAYFVKLMTMLLILGLGYFVQGWM